LSYTLIAPRTSSTTSVTYNPPYSASQPLISSPAVTFDNVSGDMCMSPTLIEVTVFTVLVQEWRSEVLVGSVMRDIQLRTINCTNNNPYVNGINNTGLYSLTACAGVPLNFVISSYDIDSTQNVSINWNNAIAGASFSSSAGYRPAGTFSWTPTAADISTASHCFTITVRDDNCPYNGSQTFSFCITVTGLSLTTSTTSANCGASNGTAEVQVLAGTGPYTYQWIGGGTNYDQNGLSAGTYTVNVTGAGGCTSSDTATVVNGAAPGNLVINSVNVSCFGAANGSATANVSGGHPPYTYLWSNGATTATISGLAPGIYSVTITTANGCLSTAAVNITEPPTAVAFTSAQSNVTCYGSSNGAATVTASGGTGAYSYSWNTSPVQTAATATNLAAGNYSALITDANGCSTTANITIAEPPSLTANGMVVSNVSCNGLADGFATVGASGGTGTYSYMWSTSPAQYTQSVSGLAPGNYFVTVTDANNCIANSFVSITEPPALAIASAAYPVTCNGACNGQTVVIPSGGTPGYSYQWLPTGGTSASATGLCPGTYSVTVTDGNGCTLGSSLAVTQPAAVTVNAAGATTICLGQNTNITAAASGGTGTYTYNWTGIGSGASQTVSPASPFTYSVTAMDANGCVSPASTVAINVTSLTAANLTVSGASAICYGSTATISSTVSGSTGPVTVNWSGGLGTGNGPFTVSPPATITYTVTVTDACGNSVTGSIPVTVNPLPVVTLSPQTLVACNEVNAAFAENSGTNSASQFNWNFGDGYASALEHPVHTYGNTGLYNVSLTVTSPFGCVSTAASTCNITVNQGSIADFSTEGMDGTTISPIYKFYNLSQNAVSYAWEFGDGGTSTVANPQHTYADKGGYEVKLYTSSSAGCMDTIIRKIEVRPVFTIYIPNAFTPDGNNTNDYFTAKGSEISEFKMMIFDRWGEMVYQTEDIQTGWDGKANNGSKPAESGVYVYKITVRDFEQRYHDFVGHVTLLTQQ
jgi:gliding motility-associated-like protein